MESHGGLVQASDKALRDRLLGLALGGSRRRHRGRPRLYSDDLIARVHALRSQTTPWSKIAKEIKREFGVTLKREAVRKLSDRRSPKSKLFYALRRIAEETQGPQAAAVTRNTPRKRRGRPQEIEISEFAQISALVAEHTAWAQICEYLNTKYKRNLTSSAYASFYRRYRHSPVAILRKKNANKYPGE